MYSPHSRFWKVAAALPLAAVAITASGQPASTIDTAQQGSLFTTHHEHVLGTSLEISVRAANPADAANAEAAALATFDRDEARLSTWRADSEVSLWAKTRFEPVKVSPELFEVLAAFDAWRERTGGALDPSVEGATRLWKNATAEGRTPSQQEIAATIEAMQQPHWSLDKTNQTATRLTDVPLALASFTKSYITSRAADAALKDGATGIMLNVGGDVVVRGNITQMVAIANPQAAAENEAALDHVIVRDRAVATSGSYRRGFELAQALTTYTDSLSSRPKQDSPIAHLQSLSSRPEHSVYIAPPKHLSSRPEARFLRRSGETPAFDRSDAPKELAPNTTPHFSHLIDPRTATPASHILSSTVIAHDATTAGALATAFSILPVEETRALAATTPGIDYLLVLAGGEQVRSANWPQSPVFRPAAYEPAKPAAPATAGLWNPAFELNIGIILPRIEDARYRRPYVAVWVEDADHFPVRTLALWSQNPRWLNELKQWYRDDQVRNLAEGTDISRTLSSATRPPGSYTLKWDGKDNEGKLVKAGKYTLCIEASREHGGYDILRHEITADTKPQQATLPAAKELGAVTLDYRKR